MRKNQGSERGGEHGLDVAVVRVQNGDQHRQPEHQEEQEQHDDRQQQKRRVEAVAHEQRDRQEQHEHREKGDELDGRNRRRDGLAREAHLAHERRVQHEARRGGEQRLREEHPHDQARQQEDWVVGDVRDVEQHLEHERVGAHQDERVDQVPRDSERGALVLLAQLSAHHLLEEKAVPHGGPWSQQHRSDEGNRVDRGMATTLGRPYGR